MLCGCNQPDIYALQDGGGSVAKTDRTRTGTGPRCGRSGRRRRQQRLHGRTRFPLELTSRRRLRCRPSVGRGRRWCPSCTRVSRLVAIDTGLGDVRVRSRGRPAVHRARRRRPARLRDDPLRCSRWKPISGETFDGKPILGISASTSSTRATLPRFDYPGPRVVRYVQDRLRRAI